MPRFTATRTSALVTIGTVTKNGRRYEGLIEEFEARIGLGAKIVSGSIKRIARRRWAATDLVLRLAHAERGLIWTLREEWELEVETTEIEQTYELMEHETPENFTPATERQVSYMNHLSGSSTTEVIYSKGAASRWINSVVSQTPVSEIY